MIQFYITWIVFAITLGAMEARIHHWRGTDIESDKLIHRFYTSVRTVVWIGLASVIYRYPVQNIVTGSQAIFLFAIVCIFVFPFFHSGAQYTARRIMDNRLDYHFFSRSTTTNAKINIGPIWRTIFAIISALIVFLIW